MKRSELESCENYRATYCPEDDKLRLTRRSDIAHIKHALQFLFPGGKLAGLCLATDHRREALRHLADEWHELPAGTFRKEGTEVATCLFLITNHNT